MKRILIWVLILQFATGHNMLAEVLRMPSLLEHYQVHLQETPRLSFLAFLGEHYLNVQHQHQNDAHGQLPLHCSHGAMADSTLPLQLPLVICTTLPADLSYAALPANNALLPSGDYESGLFRPPIMLS